MRNAADPAETGGPIQQVQRMGHPLINEVLIGTAPRTASAWISPVNDKQFAGFLLDPALPRIVNALTGGVVKIPAAPRD